MLRHDFNAAIETVLPPNQRASRLVFKTLKYCLKCRRSNCTREEEPAKPPAFSYWNKISSEIGYTTMAIGMLIFFVNIAYALFAGKKAEGNYWGEGATTLEWTLSSPPPYHQFETLPVIDDKDHH